MVEQVEDYISSSYVAENLSSGSISFGRFEIESLSWERKSCFLHNRYLEEVEKYSTPGSVTKKKEYFEAHFRKKTRPYQTLEENLKENLAEQTESINADNYNLMEDCIHLENYESVEVSCDDGDASHKVEESLKDEFSSTILNAKFQTFCGENCAEFCNEILIVGGAIQTQAGINGLHLEDETQGKFANSKKESEITEIPLMIVGADENSDFSQMKTTEASIKARERDIDEQLAQKVQSKSHFVPQMATKITPSNGNLASNGNFKKFNNQNNVAKVEKRLPSKAPLSSSTDNENFKLYATRNMKAKATSEVKSEGRMRATKAEAKASLANRRGDLCRSIDRIKLASKSEDKQCSAAFNFKSSERAEKRKEYNLKLEEKHHAKEAEMHEIQAKTKEVKEAEMKHFRRSLNFKATPMPSFYNESASKASQGKKASTNKTLIARAPPENVKLCERRRSPQPSSPPASSISRDEFSYSSKKSSQFRSSQSAKISTKKTKAMKKETTGVHVGP